MGSSGGRGGDVLSSGAVHVTASLVKVLGFLLAEGMENVDHYKMVVLRERGPWEPAASRGRRGRNRGVASSIMAMETYLCFWCQSASVCFSDIDKQVHSVILTSGEKRIGSRGASWDGTKSGIKPRAFVCGRRRPAFQVSMGRSPCLPRSFRIPLAQVQRHAS